MGQEKKPDFVMNADGELVPTDELRSADLPEPKQKPKIELPAFPKSPPPSPKASPAPKAKVPPPPPPPPTDEIELAPPRIAKPSVAPPVAKRPPPPLPPLDPRDMVEPKMWSGERTSPDRAPEPHHALAQLAQMAADEEQLAEIEPIASASINLADDLALPSRPTLPTQRPADEVFSSADEVEALIRDHKYRAVMEQVADIDGDESLDAPPPPPVQTRTPSQDVPVIRGTAVAPPPQRSPNMRPSVTGSGAPEEPAPRRGPPRVPLNRTIKEKNRGSR